MGYDKNHVAVLSPEEGYTLLASKYKEYHAMLDKRDGGVISRFLPRSLTGLSVLDVGAGDGRLAKHFVWKGLARYGALDISSRLVARAPGRCEKIVADIQEPLPFEHNTFDLLVCFFVLVHCEELQTVFRHLRGVTKEGGTLYVFHHLERREFVHEIHGNRFKIASHYYSFSHITEAAVYEWWSEDVYDIDECSKLYIFTAI